ncbi:putative hydro-lyase [Desulfofundulus salinus]|uniref:Putative hydro-lyase D7024_02050 n=1 Tax=Desulfofundulus salinus TaxID=2419843 RepID=A0A494WY94_9FIRM|nr:putative hydro-lyase [Desulfofundulus salinum]RKO65857.1 putative hydro-lyase [Desulfofundulus salinum]
MLDNLGAQNLSPAELRSAIRKGDYNRPTPGLASGYAQANLVILPKDLAFDFLLFCQRNPKPCPVLDVTEVGDPEPKFAAPGADLRTDLPRYRVYEYGQMVAEVTNITDYWRDDLVAFLLGCSFTFEEALLNAGVPVRHIEEGKNVPMFITGISCRQAGPFHGPLVVSMRPIPAHLVIRAVQVTSRYPAVHGAPVHIGQPELIGIKDLNRPDFGDAVTIYPGEVPVFWACGVTPQAVAMAAKPELMITHAPGHMFITDLRDQDLAVI